MIYATCETSGCGNAFNPIPIPEESVGVICGPCGVPVTNIEVNGPVEPKEMPTWEIG